MKTRFKGYLLIAAFFISPFVGLVYREISYQITGMGHMWSVGNPILTEKMITLYSFESLLVLGLFLIIRNHKNKQIESDNVG